MEKKLKTIEECGPFVREMLTCISRGGDSGQRAEERELSREAMRLIKARTSWRKLDLLLCGNIQEGDVYATFTWNNEHYPRDRRDAMRQWNNFKRRLTARRKRKGIKLVAFWALQRGDLGNRWHIHCVFNSGGETYAEIAALWGRGKVKADPVERDRDGGIYRSIAKYLARYRPEKLGQRAWSYTTGTVVKPKRDSFFVDGDAALEVPAGCLKIDEANRETPWGRYEFIEYEIPKF